jgi:PKD repeat protein
MDAPLRHAHREQHSFPNFSVTDTSLCQKFCIDFFDQSSNNPTAWQWIFPAVALLLPLTKSANVCYNNPGVYDVTLITTNALEMIHSR